MVQQRSFQKYVSKHHENDLFDAVSSFVSANIDDLELWSSTIDIDNLDEENISFEEMEVKYVFVNGETTSNEIEFDVVVHGDVCFKEVTRHNDEEGSCTKWFRLNCQATLDGELKNFTVLEVEPYDKKQNHFQRRLSDALVPIISIYYEYIEGASECKIAKGLEADGILTGAGKTKWWPSSLTKMLTNEKYMGDALLAKTYTVDFLSKKRVKNNGIVPQYYVKNSHPAILSKEVFNMAQEERARRSKVHKKQRGRVAGNGYSSQFALSGRVICSECGEIYRLFYNSPMEACIVICRSKKPRNRENRILFINAKNEVTRVNTCQILN